MTALGTPPPAEGRAGVVEVVDLTMRFGAVQALAGVSFRLEPGTFYALLGPSGCGKTTLLRLLAGFQLPTSGRILIGDQDVAQVPPYRRPVNTVFQHYALFPHMDVARNVGYGLRQRRPVPDRKEQERRIEEALGLVRLTGFGHRRSWELSGGQQQRVALARAIINRPTVLLLDEPLGALDLKLRREMQVELKQLQEQLGITFIFVTHDQDEALSMADRVAVMRDGLILQDGPPAHIYDRPADPWVASFIGHMNFLPGRVEGAGETAAVRLERGPVLRGQLPEEPIGVGEEALLAVRPERIWLMRSSDGSTAEHPGPAFPGRIVRSVFMGDKVEHIVDSPAVGTLVISAPNVESGGSPAPVAGEEVIVGWMDDAARIIRERRPVA
jgi:spermidine/putrescine transport system ATP-binding protein